MSTIDYGIDLGTTNSALARQDGRQQRLLPGPDGDALLPSAIHVLASGEVVVGTRARAALDTDPQNATMEFKRLMAPPRRSGSRRRGASSPPSSCPPRCCARCARAPRPATASRRAPR